MLAQGGSDGRQPPRSHGAGPMSDGSVSLDLLIRSFFALGGTAHDLAEVVAEPVQAIAS
jgi:hypothetical protein